MTSGGPEDAGALGTHDPLPDLILWSHSHGLKEKEEAAHKGTL